jgi:hypothetical protein
VPRGWSRPCPRDRAKTPNRIAHFSRAQSPSLVHASELSRHIAPPSSCNSLKRSLLQTPGSISEFLPNSFRIFLTPSTTFCAPARLVALRNREWEVFVEARPRSGAKGASRSVCECGRLCSWFQNLQALLDTGTGLRACPLGTRGVWPRVVRCGRYGTRVGWRNNRGTDNRAAKCPSVLIGAA